MAAAGGFGFRVPFSSRRHSSLRRRPRLLTNLLLLRGGYPPVSIRPEDRKAYLDSLERAPLADDFVPYQIFMHQRLDATLADNLRVLEEARP